VDYLAAHIEVWNEQTASPLNLGCPSMVVDTTSDYEPPLDQIIGAIVEFASERP
jgi:hypothetical protein